MIEITRFNPQKVVKIHARKNVNAAYAVYGNAEIKSTDTNWRVGANVDVVVYGTSYSDDEHSIICDGDDCRAVEDMNISSAFMLETTADGVYPVEVEFDGSVENRMIEIIKNRGVI